MQENSSNSRGLFEENKTVIYISDSEEESNQLSESEPEMEIDPDSHFFGITTDSFIQKSLIDDKLRIQSWLLQLFRKCRMVAEIYQMQKDSTNPLQPVLRQNIYSQEDSRELANVLTEIKERNREGKTSFFVFTEMSQILKKMRCSALMDPAIYSKICFILEDFALGSSLNPENFTVLKNYLSQKI